MDANNAIQGDSEVEGPTLYLDSETFDEPGEAFCTAVLDDPSEDYRVVQLTASESFDSLRDSLAAQLERVNNPSEAAVIITTPQAEGDSAVSEVEDIPLYGFRVNPEDLTGITVAFSRLLENWDESGSSVKICLRDVESLLPYHEPDLVYRFLNTVLATLQGAGADVHVHLHPPALDEQTLQMFKSLFANVVDEEGSTLEAVSEQTSEESIPQPDSVEQTSGESVDVKPTAMADDEIDEFLDSEGYGTLALGGEPPYAIPMSFGYEPETRNLYMHMGVFEGSEKRKRIEQSDTAALTVTRYKRPDQWRSVLIEGSISSLSREEVEERDVLEVFAKGELASVDVFNRDPADVSFEWFVLEPESITGRRSEQPL